MNKPVLVVMAAGMGSRYGGLKQVDPVGPEGQLIIDYSLYDARRAGFETVIFIIKKAIDQTFRAAIGSRMEKLMTVRYAYQELESLPSGFSVPKDRIKPWGTSHAVLSALPLIDGPFAVINSDDYYGPHAFQEIYQYLSSHDDESGTYAYSMVGYELRNTVTKNGHVARGVCKIDEKGCLQEVTEHTHIELRGEKIFSTDDQGATWQQLPGTATVSMNLWGFTQSFLRETQNRFAAFLQESLPQNPITCEYFLPSVVSQLIAEHKAQVQVLHSPDKWYGVTYQADKPEVVAAIQSMTEQGLYPHDLGKANR